MPPVPLFDAGAEQFRHEVCAFLAAEMATERTAGHEDPTDRTGLDHGFERALQRAAGRRGYLAVSVDRAHGGGGRPRSYAAAFQYEAAYHDAPLVDTAVVLAGSPIMTLGTAEQRVRLVPPMLAGELAMCIAYTEPAAGNDLSAVSTTAETGADGFVLDGLKTLVTGADKADYCLTVAVTDPAAGLRQRLSMFVVDMRSPGVTVVGRPTMSRYSLWDVRFDRVALGSDALLGQPGGGWHQLAAAVEEERNGMFILGWCQRLLDELVAYCAEGGLLDDPSVADTVAGLWCDLQVGRRFALRLVEEEERGSRTRSAGSLAKVHLTELAQRIAAAGTELAGPAGAVEGSLFVASVPYAAAGGRFCFEYLFRVDGPVSVGANELHRATIAQLGLGLPRP
jgi:alkylation response protein AidB-like acyl-CoA dehydrogenase